MAQPPAWTEQPGSWQVDVATHIGGRPRQEDRYCLRPFISVGANCADAAFFGVWDGTVDAHASEYVHTRCADHHVRTPGFARYQAQVQGQASGSGQAKEQGTQEALAESLAAAVREGYAATDAE